MKIKIGITCVYKRYEVKREIVQQQRLQLKMKFLLGYSLKLLFSGEMNLCRWVACWGSGFFLVGGWANILLVGEFPNPPSRENSDIRGW